MALVKFGLNGFVDDQSALGKKMLAQRAAGGSSSIPLRASASPAPAPAVAPAPVMSRPKTIPEAIDRGFTNSEIHRFIADGTIKRFDNRGVALRQAPGHYQEMLRRGLV